MSHAPIVILTGPTATGKTGLAIELALAAASRGAPPLEVINADSLLVYREMNIGTAKPTPIEMRGVLHHLIDIRNPDQAFTAGDFVRATHVAIDEIESRGHRAMIVGGTGFYLRALLYGLWDAPEADLELRRELEKTPDADLYTELHAKDPEAALRIGQNDHYRLVRALEIIRTTGKTPTELEEAQTRVPDPRFRLWIIDRDPEELDERIAERAKQMIEAGLLEETRKLHDRYGEIRPLKSVGYTEALRFIEGEKPPGRKPRSGIDGLLDEITLGTRRLVKKQRTWFRGELKRMPKDQAREFFLDRDREILKKDFAQSAR